MAVAAMLALVSAFLVSLLAVQPCARLARLLGVVDRPGPLKVQTTPVPYLGGLAVMLGLLASASSSILAAELSVRALLPLSIALFLGLADDWRDLPVLARVVGELGAGAALAWALPTRLGTAGWPLAVLLELLLVNGVNLLDGLDGLAASTVAASSVGFALLLPASGKLVAVGGIGALAGFLVHNRPPARIYLGDAGSYLLGTMLALLFADAWGHEVATPVSVGACLLIALPVGEVAWAVVRRRRSGLPLFAGDRGHSYDRLAARGIGVGRIALIAAGLQLAIAALGIAAGHAGVVGASVVVVVVAAGLLLGGGAAGFLSPVSENAG